MKSLFKRKPAKPDKPKPVHPPGPCLNCGTHLDRHDLFCPNCGQKRLEKEDLSFRNIITESFFDYFHFDSKFFRTLFPLIFNPGKLTVEFMEGKRKSFLEPFRLFLVISIVYFLILPLTRESGYEPDQAGKNGSSASQNDTGNIVPSKFTLNGKPLSRAGQDSIRREIDTIGMTKFLEKNFQDKSRTEKMFLRHVLRLIAYSGQSFTTVLEHTASKLIFLLIPLFALLLKLMYFNSKRLYYEHFVFSLHIHAFVFLLLIATLLAGFLVNVNPLIVASVSLIYFFFAMKKNYKEKAGKTLWKFFLLIFLYCIIALPVFFILLILVSIFLI